MRQRRLARPQRHYALRAQVPTVAKFGHACEIVVIIVTGRAYKPFLIGVSRCKVFAQAYRFCPRTSGRHELVLLPAWFPRACVVGTTHVHAPRTLCAMRIWRTPPAPSATRTHDKTPQKERNRLQPRKLSGEKFSAPKEIARSRFGSRSSAPKAVGLHTVRSAPASQACELDTQNRSRFNRLPQST